MNTLCLFSGGKDSVYALDHELEKGNSCISLITTDDLHAILSDGPESKIEVVKAISEQIFGVEAVACHITAQNFKDNLLSAVVHLVDNYGIERIVTGDIDHPDGIIHFLRKNLLLSHPYIQTESAGEMFKGTPEEYMEHLAENFDIEIVGLRLPDFAGIEDEFIGQKINTELIGKLKNKIIEITGEDGEYQTLVLGKKDGKRLYINCFERTSSKGRDSKNHTYVLKEIKEWEVR